MKSVIFISYTMFHVELTELDYFLKQSLNALCSMDRLIIILKISSNRLLIGPNLSHSLSVSPQTAD